MRRGILRLQIMFSHKVQELESWIKSATQLGIDEINIFIGGITSDLEAVPAK